MNKPEQKKGQVIGFQDRPLGGSVLRTYRRRADIDDIEPNDKQPRIGSKEDEELLRQIKENDGVFEPLLVEPHPVNTDKFRIIDGERRWTNSKILVEQGKEQFRNIPIEVTDRTLSDEERLRVWVYIHRQRKEWDAREKEMVAYQLIQLMGPTTAADILGISSRELDRLVEVYELSERFKGLKDLNASITWARELIGVNKNLRTQTVIEAVVKKVAEKRITNSKDLRKLRTILADPVAKENFMSEEGDIETAMLRLGEPSKRDKHGLSDNLAAVIDSVKNVRWTALADMKKNPEFLKRIDEASSLLQSLRNELLS
jgi:ParB family transcriptional regulator, chromosome partitioning protein